MKKIKVYVTFLFLVLQWKMLYAQVTNGGFENWAIDSTTGVLTPVGWQAPLVNGGACVVQSQGYSGTYSAKFICNPDGFGDYDGGIMQIDNMPINTLPTSLSGVWKVFVAPSSADNFNIWAEVYDASQNVLSSTALSPGFGVSIPTWTNFTEPFGVTGSGIPATMTISLELSQLVDDPNTFAEFDDLSLQFSTATYDFKNVLTALSVQVDKSTDEININFAVTQKTDLKFELFDLSGRVLLQTQSDNYRFGKNTITFYKDIPQGIYVVKAISSKDLMQFVLLIINAGSINFQSINNFNITIAEVYCM